MNTIDGWMFAWLDMMIIIICCFAVYVVKNCSCVPQFDWKNDDTQEGEEEMRL